MKTSKHYLLAIFVAFSFSLQAKTIRYVTANGTGDGSSWINASNSIQNMIDSSTSGDEVWVAKGTYYPTNETIDSDTRSRTFFVKEGVSIYGGFVGTETNISERKLADLDGNGRVDSCELVNTTLLSGNIDGIADTWTKTLNSDGFTMVWKVTGNEGNCYRVVTCNGNNKIDGFSVTGGNANETQINNGSGIYGNSSSFITNCIVTYCSSNGYGAGIGVSLSIVSNCAVSNCSTVGSGGGIYASSSPIRNCTVTNCSASYGGGIYSESYLSSSSVTNCEVSNCSASSYGGGIYTTSYSFVTNCTIHNCSALCGGGIFAYVFTSVINCAVSNCFAVFGGGYNAYNYDHNFITNSAFSNNKSGSDVGNGISGGFLTNFNSTDIIASFVRPTSFIGVSTIDIQQEELISSDWHLKVGSPCINAGTLSGLSQDMLNGKDLDNHPRVVYGAIDIGAYEFIYSNTPTVSIPVSENFNEITNWDNSLLFYYSNIIGSTKWILSDQKTFFKGGIGFSSYSCPLSTCEIDGTNVDHIFLRYDMDFEALEGAVYPLGTEQLAVEYSFDFENWLPIATYSNTNGNIPNQTYIHDLSAQLAGKKFYIRFNAKGEESVRIEKWGIDNVIINTDGSSAVNPVYENRYKYSIDNGVLNIDNLEQASLIQVFDVNGKLIVAQKSDAQIFSLIFPAHGTYVVRVSSDSGIEIKKIVW